MSGSTSPTNPHQPHSPAAAPETIRWRNWPLRDHPLRSGITALLLLAVAMTTYALTSRASLAALAAGAVAISLWRMLLPVEFELSSGGIQQRVLGRRRILPWRTILRWEICDDGILLLPHDDHSALAPMRGLFLPFSNHREAITAHVDHYLAGRPPVGSSVSR